MKLEHRKRKRRKPKVDLQRIVLDTVAVAGFLSVAVLAPNALVAFKKFGLLPQEHHRFALGKAQERLIKKGLLVYRKGFVQVTVKGTEHLKKLALQKYAIPKPKKWDGLWRVLIFDIPEDRKKIRIEIRATLSSVGFVRLQDSVWLYPYPCEGFVELLKANLQLSHEMLYLIVDTLESDEGYIEFFGLKG